MMKDGSAIIICGDPLPAAILALRLLATPEAPTIYADFSELQRSEGELFPLTDMTGGVNSVLAPLVTAEFPGFTVIDRNGQTHFDFPIGLIDPIQCLLELDGRIRGNIAEAPPHARETIVPEFDPVEEPAQLLHDPAMAQLRRPVLFEQAGAGCAYNQFIPLNEEMVMVRHRSGEFTDPDTYFAHHRAIAG